MRKIHILFIAGFAFLAMAMQSDLPAYKLFNEKGKEANFKKLVKDAADADIVLFGELHNNPISHWMQLELTKALYAEKGSNLILGAEMFETDNQLIMDEYLSGAIKQKNFQEEAKLWKNYKNDYKPLVEFAKENELQFIASNVPRRYASLVHNDGFEGLDSLSDNAKALLPDLPIDYDPDLPGYKSMMDMMAGMGDDHPANPNLPKAQAIKDATMANSILNYFEPGKLIIHYNGAYHSNNYEGIMWYLKRNNPELKILTITSVEQENVEELEGENSGLADYTICIPFDMTKTY